MKTTFSIIAIALLLFTTSAFAQKFITKNGHISFYSSAPLEDIEAHNNQVNAVLDTETGEFVFKVLIKSFQFEKALMQEHFNENYLESDKYPTSVFKGKVSNLHEIDFTKPGTYAAVVEGDLTIHGVTQPVTSKGTFEVKSGSIAGTSEFMVGVDDYDIKIPKTVVNNIAEEIKITVDIELEPLEGISRK
ncbi:MAG: YceI family protein [Bacteroidales bacterium]